MVKAESKVVHVKTGGKGHDCVWHTFYRGQDIPENLVQPYLAHGGIIMKEEVKIVEPVKEVPKVEEKVEEVKTEKPRRRTTQRQSL